MRRTLLSILAVAVLASAATPLAGAEVQREHYYLTSDPHPEVSDVLHLSTAGQGTGGRVDLGLEPVEWRASQLLEIAAPIDEEPFGFNLTFDAGGGDVTVTIGYRDGAGVVNSWSKTVPIDDADLAGLVFGSATGQILASEPIPAGVTVFMTIATSDPNQLVTDESFLLSDYESTASLPLPELSALVLVAVGVLAVAGIARSRARTE